MLTHGDAQFTWMQGSTSGHVRICSRQDTFAGLIYSSQLIPANRPSLAVAQWHINPRTDELILEIFEEAPVESGLLEAIVLSVVLLQSGRSLGDSSGHMISPSNPMYYTGPSCMNRYR
jgi:hypothetical protein